MTGGILIVILLAGGLIAWLVQGQAARWVSVATLLAALGFALAQLPATGGWIDPVDLRWIPELGVHLHFGMDGLSLVLVLLTVVLGLVAVAASWTEITDRVGFFHFNLLWTLAGVVGVFTALDLLLFYFFWELMLVPMYFLIAIWGHEDRRRAAIKFFIFTQASGLLMLVSILGLVFVHRAQTGVLTFDYLRLLGTPVHGAAGVWLMLGFFAAFAVKLPALPLHTWLPDAHTQAPTAGSIILAGLLLKTGAYGLLRFALPLFPDASAAFAPVAMGLGVAGIVYGAVLAFPQRDLKRLVAYTSVSHLGFVLLGIYAGGALARQGAVLQMVCHGLSVGGLFFLVGALDQRLGTRDLEAMGGLWARVPRMGAATMLFVMASLGLPGLGNFVAEFLVLLGSFRHAPAFAVVATLGLVLSTIYSLRIVQRAFHGESESAAPLPDLAPREILSLGVLVVGLVWLGLGPQPLFSTVAHSFGWLTTGTHLALGGMP